MDGRATTSCDFCGGGIPPSEFESGRAVRVLKKTFCARCAAAAIERSKREDFAPEFLTPQPGRLRSPLGPS